MEGIVRALLWAVERPASEQIPGRLPTGLGIHVHDEDSFRRPSIPAACTLAAAPAGLRSAP